MKKISLALLLLLPFACRADCGQCMDNLNSASANLSQLMANTRYKVSGISNQFDYFGRQLFNMPASNNRTLAISIQAEVRQLANLCNDVAEERQMLQSLFQTANYAIQCAT